MEKTYIFGHRKPDTDSVTSAISLSYLKNKQGMNTIPAVLSSINLESKFVLNYFNIEEPIFLNDVNIKIKDLKYTKNYTINENESIYTAYYKMNSANISKIPIVDKNKNLLGIVSMKDIAKEQFSFNYSYVNTSYENIIKALNGSEVVKFNNEITFIDSESLKDTNDFVKFLIHCSFKISEIVYKVLGKFKLSAQQMRDVLPLATKTELIMTGTTEQWNEFFKLRCSKNAHPDARKLAEQIKEKIDYLNR